MMHGATESSGDLTPEQTHSFTWGEEDRASSNKLSVELVIFNYYSEIALVLNAFNIRQMKDVH